MREDLFMGGKWGEKVKSEMSKAGHCFNHRLRRLTQILGRRAGGGVGLAAPPNLRSKLLWPGGFCRLMTSCAVFTHSSAAGRLGVEPGVY
jgi:hypothetical protein